MSIADKLITIADKLITIADNTPNVAEAANAAKSNVTGTCFTADDVLNAEHQLSILLKSKNLIVTSRLDTEVDKTKVIFDGSVTGDFVFSCLFNYSECKTPTAAQFEFIVDGVAQYMARGSTDKVSKKLTGTITRVRYLNWGYGVGTVENIQLESGTTATQYTPYVADCVGKEVKIYGKNLFNITDRVVRNFGATPNTTQRTFTENSIYVNVSVNNYCVAGHRMSCEKISDSSFTVLIPSASQSGWEAYGAGFNFKVNQNAIYSVSASYDATKGKYLGCAFYDGDGYYISNTSKLENITPPDNCVWMNVVFGVRVRDEAVLYENVMLEQNTTSTEFQPFTNQTAASDTECKVAGLHSVSPSTTVICDNDITADVEYFPQSASDTYSKYIQLKSALTELKIVCKVEIIQNGVVI